MKQAAVMKNSGGKPNTKLDSEELLHLAIRESEANRHEQAIEYLKRALELKPDDANIYYMLGAEHAQIGLYDRALEEMSKAVELDADLVTAHFQIGLLNLTSGRIPEADAAWKPLDDLGDENPFYLFKTGLLHLVKDEFTESIELLNKGISLNNFNAPLNKDMERILGEIYERNPDLKPDTESESESSSVSSHVFLSAYKNNTEQD